MIVMTLRENKRSLQPTAEAGDLTEIALCQVLRLLFGLLPGGEQVTHCFGHPHPVWGGVKKCVKKLPYERGRWREARPTETVPGKAPLMVQHCRWQCTL